MLRKTNYDVNVDTDDIAILGGSFNPIHNAHLAMAETVHNIFNLKIIIMPNKKTYYKDNSLFVNDSDRLEMIKLSIQDYDYMYMSDMEIVRGGTTFTIDTIETLRSINDKRKIYFIIGGDSLEWLTKWVRADELLRYVTFLTIVRGSTDSDRSKNLIQDIKEEYPYSDIRLLDMPEIPVSSTEIRNNINDGKSIKGMVPDSVRDYIIQNKLYTNKA